MTDTGFPIIAAGGLDAPRCRCRRLVRIGSTVAVISGLAVAGCAGAPPADPRLDGVRAPVESKPASEPSRSYDTTNVDALDSDPRLQKLRETDDKPNPKIQHRRYSRGERRPFDIDFGGEDPPPDAEALRRLAIEQSRLDGRLGSVDRTLDQIEERTIRKPSEERRDDLGDVSREVLLQRERSDLVHRRHRAHAEQRRIEHERHMRLEAPAPAFGGDRFSVR